MKTLQHTADPHIFSRRGSYSKQPKLVLNMLDPPPPLQYRTCCIFPLACHLQLNPRSLEAFDGPYDLWEEAAKEALELVLDAANQPMILLDRFARVFEIFLVCACVRACVRAFVYMRSCFSFCFLKLVSAAVSAALLGVGVSETATIGRGTSSTIPRRSDSGALQLVLDGLSVAPLFAAAVSMPLACGGMGEGW